jgi:hypothetical protein
MAPLVPLSEAVAQTVHDGDVVALEGFTHLIPVLGQARTSCNNTCGPTGARGTRSSSSVGAARPGPGVTNVSCKR